MLGVSFRGRVGRQEFFSYNLLNAAAILIVALAYREGGGPKDISSLVLSFVLLVLGFVYSTLFIAGLFIRRLHDVNKSGWLSILYLIPIVGLFFFWPFVL